MSVDVRPVQGRRVEDRLLADRATTDARAVGDRADASGEPTLSDVEAKDRVSALTQPADECLAKMTGAFRDNTCILASSALGAIELERGIEPSISGQFFA
jgi:hypothetical protein